MDYESDYAANLNTRRSQNGYMFTLFANVMALSTTKVVFVIVDTIGE